MKDMLLPCPRCGSGLLIPTEIIAGYGRIGCCSCGFEFPDGKGGMDMYAPTELVEKWNALSRKEKQK